MTAARFVFTIGLILATTTAHAQTRVKIWTAPAVFDTAESKARTAAVTELRKIVVRLKVTPPVLIVDAAPDLILQVLTVGTEATGRHFSARIVGGRETIEQERYVVIAKLTVPGVWEGELAGRDDESLANAAYTLGRSTLQHWLEDNAAKLAALKIAP